MKLLWLDLETTGLNPRHDLILEAACAVADLKRPFDLGPMVQGVLPFQEKSARETASDPIFLSPFVGEMHTKNGLLAECAAHPWPLAYEKQPRGSRRELEQRILDILPPPTDTYEDKVVLAGASVHFDHEFIKTYLPELNQRLSHRHYDVSAVKLFCRSLGMSLMKPGEAHRAADDVLEAVSHARECARWLQGWGDDEVARSRLASVRGECHDPLGIWKNP